MPEEIIYSASWLLNPNASPVVGGALLVRDGIICEIGELRTLRSKYSAKVVDYPDCALIPGFVNAHTHLELTHFPSWLHRSAVDYQPRRFTDWIIQLIKVARGLTVDDYPPSIKEGIRICLESGTTAVGEILTNPMLAEHYHNSALAGRLYFELLGQDELFFQSKLNVATKSAISNTSTKLCSGLSPHSPYTIAEANLPSVRQVAALHSLPLSIHLSESTSEADFMFEGSGDFATEFYPFVGWQQYLGRPARCSSTEFLDRNGLLTPKTVAVHCVHLSLADARIIKSRGTHIVLCPRSNDILDVGCAPVSLFKKLGIPLALGTDSLASNNSLSIWDELRFALKMFNGVLSENELFCMVTRGGAEALGIFAECGSLTAGKVADFQVVKNCEGDENKVLANVMREGVLKEVFVRGVCVTI